MSDPTTTIPPDPFRASRQGSGTSEWAESFVNIQTGCQHDCRYCYAAASAAQAGKRARADWHREEPRPVNLTSHPRKKGVVMFPTEHDITPTCLTRATATLRQLVTAGNQVLVVTKPHLECIEVLCRELFPWRAQLLFRFTLGSLDPAVCAFWEPGAPPPTERLAALKHAFAAGYRTSVSSEPMLAGTAAALELLAAVRPLVTDTVWFGKMNRLETRLNLADPAEAAAAASIEALQADAEILRLVAAVGPDPLVEWKQSIKDVITKADRQP